MSHRKKVELVDLTSSIIESFKRAENEINQLKEQQKVNARATFQGMTGSGKSRYVSELVEYEKEQNSNGAQARVAEMLNLSPGRISQLVSSDKNRKNGK